MSAAAINFYKADLDAIRFTLYEHLDVHQLFKLDRFAHLSREDCDAIVEQCLRFATEVTGPLNGPGDRAGCRQEDGRVTTPPGFPEAWRRLFELGFMSFTVPQDDGGIGGPAAVGVILSELLSGANTAFNMYAGLTHGAADLVAHFARPEDRRRYLPSMLDGRFSGTMCLSEPHAGSDVGATRTRATPLDGQHLRHLRHEVLDLGGRPRPRPEHHPSRAGADRRGSAGHQGPVALHRAQGVGAR